MFGLGFWEIALIFVVALLVLGPTKIPELARGLGKALREFRKATDDFKASVHDEAYADPGRLRPIERRPLATPTHSGESSAVEPVAPTIAEPPSQASRTDSATEDARGASIGAKDTSSST